MAISSELKTSICYSSKEAKLLCEGYLNDESIEYNRSISAIREAHLLETILPEDRNASLWIQQLYIAGATIGEVMENVFCYLAAGINLKASQTEGTKQLVEYGYSHVIGKSRTSVEENEISEAYYFFNCIDSLVNKLSFEEEQITDKGQRYLIMETKRQLEYLYEMKNEQNSRFGCDENIRLIYMSLLNHWDIFSNYTYTYRMLASIARIQKWNSSSKERLELVKVLKKATLKWTY